MRLRDPGGRRRPGVGRDSRRCGRVRRLADPRSPQGRRRHVRRPSARPAAAHRGCATSSMLRVSRRVPDPHDTGNVTCNGGEAVSTGRHRQELPAVWPASLASRRLRLSVSQTRAPPSPPMLTNRVSVGDECGRLRKVEVPKHHIRQLAAGQLADADCTIGAQCQHLTAAGGDCHAKNRGSLRGPHRRPGRRDRGRRRESRLPTPQPSDRPALQGRSPGSAV